MAIKTAEARIINTATREPIPGLDPILLPTWNLTGWVRHDVPGLADHITAAHNAADTHGVGTDIVWAINDAPVGVSCACCTRLFDLVGMYDATDRTINGRTGVVCGNCDGDEQPGCPNCNEPAFFGVLSTAG